MRSRTIVRTFPLLAAILLLFCTRIPARAGGWNPDVVPASMPTFLAGFVGGIALHELGHAAVASSKGYSIHNSGLSIVYSPNFATRADRLQVSSAGFQAQWLTAESAFYYRSKAPDLTAGLISAHLAISAAYLVALRNHPLGDTVSASRASGISTDQLVLMAAVPALLDGWRLLGTDVPAWVAPLSIGFKGGCMTAIWTY